MNPEKNKEEKAERASNYITRQPKPFSALTGAGDVSDVDARLRLRRFSISARHSSKTWANKARLINGSGCNGRQDSQTLVLFFALVSTQAAWFCKASFSPSLGSTWRLGELVGHHETTNLLGRHRDDNYLDCRSVFEPTMTQGIS